MTLSANRTRLKNKTFEATMVSLLSYLCLAMSECDGSQRALTGLPKACRSCHAKLVYDFSFIQNAFLNTSNKINN